MAALGLCCCTQSFSADGKQGPLFIVVCELRVVVASLVAVLKLSRPTACGIFLSQGLNWLPPHCRIAGLPGELLTSGPPKESQLVDFKLIESRKTTS